MTSTVEYVLFFAILLEALETTVFSQEPSEHSGHVLTSAVHAQVNSTSKLSNSSTTDSSYSFHQELAIHRSNCDQDSDCPMWAQCTNSTCTCREPLQQHRTVHCDPVTLQLSVIKCHCVTFENETGELFEGSCTQNCQNNDENSEYLSIPLNVSTINNFMCENKWNRTGRLCGKCLQGHSPLAYSYDLRCVRCPEGITNIWKFVLAALGPLTIFYFVVLFFKIKATSSYLHGYLIFSQIISTPAFARNLPEYIRNNPQLRVPLQTVTAMYAMWNLDFLKSIYPEICLKVSNLTILALEYVVALYPMVMITASYVLIELHKRNFKLVVLCWKPFRVITTFFRRNWDFKSSVIDVFITFFMLSFTKILSVSSDLLIPVAAHELTSNNITWVLYYDATIEYFGSEHMPFAVVAIFFVSLFAVLPILLLVLYQFLWFQRLLNQLHIKSPTLHVLMDSIQGSYKDGTEPNTQDCRWFSGVPLVGRFTLLLLYSATLDGSFMPLAAAVVISILLLTVVVMPHKSSFSSHTKNEAIFWGFLSIFYSINDSVTYSSLKPEIQTKITKVLRIIAGIAPLVYMSGLTIYLMLSRVKKLKRFLSQVRALRRGYQDIEEGCDESMPHRVTNPDEYKRVNIQESINWSDPSKDIDTY